MLPEDARQCKEAALDSSLQTQQMILSDHFHSAEVTIPYSDKAFEEAVIEWLIHTNQVHSSSISLVANL